MVQICILHDRNMYSIGTNLYLFYMTVTMYSIGTNLYLFYMTVTMNSISTKLYLFYMTNHKFYWYTFLFILHDSNHVFYQYKFVFYMTVIMYSIDANFYFNLLSIYIVGIDKRFSDGCRGRSRILQDTERCNVNNKCWRLQPFYTSSCTNYAQECPWY